MSNEILLNGRFVPYESAAISVGDRAVQFAESVYEVIVTYRGRPFEMGRHLRRLRASAEAIGIDLAPRLDELASQLQELLRRSELPEATIYVQVSSGAVAPRAHLRPAGLVPTIFATVSPKQPVPDRWRLEGITCITVADERWARCYVKTTMLLPNTAAKRRAVDAGCDDAIFVRDGFVTEATAANVFTVIDGTLRTHPKSNYILHGVTREVVLELAAQVGIPFVEGPVPVQSLLGAQEVFFSGTTFEVASVTTIDGKSIGDGRPGPVARRLLEAFKTRTVVA